MYHALNPASLMLINWIPIPEFPETLMFHKQYSSDSVGIETANVALIGSFPETTRSGFYNLTLNQTLRDR